jgi:hypothetical protein
MIFPGLTRGESFTKSNKFSPGLQVGKKVPNFQLTDQNGYTQQLSGLIGENWISFVYPTNP